MRGRAAVTRRSKNSYMRLPRNVTFAPIGMPLRSLKFAIAFRARVTTGCWPLPVWVGAWPSLRSTAALNGLLALAAHADAGPVGQRHGPRTRGLLTRGAKQHHVREVNGRFPLQDPSLSVLLARLRMTLDDVDLFDRDLAVETEHAEDLAGFAAILARHDDDRVPLAHMALGRDFQGAVGAQPASTSHLQHLRCKRDDLHVFLPA